jgi:hypothetical protein
MSRKFLSKSWHPITNINYESFYLFMMVSWLVLTGISTLINWYLNWYPLVKQRGINWYLLVLTSILNGNNWYLLVSTGISTCINWCLDWYLGWYQLVSWLVSWLVLTGILTGILAGINWFLNWYQPAHTTPVQEYLGSILTQTQNGILTEKLSSPFFQTTVFKTISFICNIVMSSWNK